MSPVFIVMECNVQSFTNSCLTSIRWIFCVKTLGIKVSIGGGNYKISYIRASATKYTYLYNINFCEFNKYNNICESTTKYDINLIKLEIDIWSFDCLLILVVCFKIKQDHALQQTGTNHQTLFNTEPHIFTNVVEKHYRTVVFRKITCDNKYIYRGSSELVSASLRCTKQGISTWTA